jgi:hypothetical protein
MVDANGVRCVLGLLFHFRTLVVVRAVGIASRSRMADVLEHLQRDRIHQLARNHVVGERVLLEAAAANRAARERVEDLVLGAERQQLREVAVAHLLARDRRRAVVSRPRLGKRLVAVDEERLVPPVVEAGDYDRTAGDRGPPRVAEVRERNVVRVGEEVVGPQTFGRLDEVSLARELVGSGLQHEVRHAAFGVAEAGVERRRLYLELLDQALRRHERGGDLSRIRGGGARQAVDRHVAAVRAHAVHRVADDVGGLEGTIEAGRSHERGAGGEADERIRIAVRDGQLGDAARVDHLAERAAGGFEERRFSGHRDRFFGGADLERQLEPQPIVHADLDALAHQLLESRELHGDLVGAGDQIGNLEESLAVRDRGDAGVPLHVGDRDSSTRDDRLAAVDDRARNRAA